MRLFFDWLDRTINRYHDDIGNVLFVLSLCLVVVTLCQLVAHLGGAM